MITGERIELGGCPVDLLGHDDAVAAISRRLATDGAAPLGVVSVNLDHIHHFGTGARWHGAIETGAIDDIDWLNLIDGAPVATQARRMTGETWPRLAGSDLTGPILDIITSAQATVGFFGGMPETLGLLRAKLTAERPGLKLSGFWAPSRDELEDPERSRELALEVNASGTDVLVVGLGKPRQELWIAEHGKATGARVLLAFGAVVDFLAGRVERSPAWVASAGLEWAWRLSREPRRLASRYLVDGPPAYVSVHRSASVGSSEAAPLLEPRRPMAGVSTANGFVTDASPVDVAVIIVTYNSAGHIARLIASLRAECVDQRMRVIVADNGSMDGTHKLLALEPDILTVETGGNVGYAQGINAAMSRVGAATSVLILNPDLLVERGSIRTMRDRLDSYGAGIVVPCILDSAGEIYTSLRREPSISRAIGDALVGRRFSRRPEWTGEIDFDRESYRHAHPVDWATGAALLVDRRVADAVGAWDSRFFLYSEETDFFQRVRDEGFTAWYEPMARVRHDQGGSGSSGELSTLMAINRVRYIRKHRSQKYAAAFRAAVVLHEALRSYDPAHRETLRMLLDEGSWWRLPRGSRLPPSASPEGALGSVIIPAHNEGRVIARTLQPLAAAAWSGRLHVVVVCNGCTDDTAAIASRFEGVRVVELGEPSKIAALNTGDLAATAWPRLYLDADIEVGPGTIAQIFDALTPGGRLAARPEFRYDTSGASALVKAYYRARQRLPTTRSALWGAGAYAITESGHKRFGRFPPLIADDLFVDRSFSAAEKTVVATAPARVRTPRSSRALIAVLTRQHRGNLQSEGQSTTRSTVRALASSVRGVPSLFDAVAYALLTIVGRRAARALPSDDRRWHRDESSR